MLADSDGKDVRQLKRNLLALGFTDHRSLTLDDHFDLATVGRDVRVAARAGRARRSGWSAARVGRVPPRSLCASAAQRSRPRAPRRNPGPRADLTLDRAGGRTSRWTRRCASSCKSATVSRSSSPRDRPRPERVSHIGADTTAAASGPVTPTGRQRRQLRAGRRAAPPPQPSTGAPASVPVTISLRASRRCSWGSTRCRSRSESPTPFTVNVLAVPIGALLALDKRRVCRGGRRRAAPEP